MKQRISAKETADILASPWLDRHDIEKLSLCGKEYALKIMRMCRTLVDVKPILRDVISTESYLLFCGYPKGTWMKVIRGDFDVEEEKLLFKR